MRSLLTLLACLFCAPAWGATITLTADITSSATKAYTVASNTVLDLNGHTITCAPGDPSTAVTFGVYALSTSNVTIKNGSITGCFFGVHASYSSNITIENVDLGGNTYIGVNLGGATGAVVRNSTFVGITGYAPEAYAIGVNGVGTGALIEGNTFGELYRQPTASGVGEGVGVLVSAGSSNVTVRNNTFANQTQVGSQLPIAIWLATNVDHVLIDGNSSTGFPTGVRAGESVPAADLDMTGNTFALPSIVPGSTGLLIPSCTLASGGGAVAYNHSIASGNADGAFSIDPATGAVSENDPPGGSDRLLEVEVAVTMPPPVVTTCVATNNTITNFAIPFGPGVTDGGGNLIAP